MEICLFPDHEAKFTSTKLFKRFPYISNPVTLGDRYTLNKRSDVDFVQYAGNNGNSN